MSAEQFVRYKQQLRDITKKFIDAASMLNDDQLEIVLARLMDRITEDPDKAFQDKYKGLILADILEMRQAGVVVKQNPGWRTKQEIRDEYYVQINKKNNAIVQRNTELRLSYLNEKNKWLKKEGVFKAWLGLAKTEPPPEPKYEWCNESPSPLWDSPRISEFLIKKVADFPIVPKVRRPEDKAPSDCTPSREEIKRLTYKG